MLCKVDVTTAQRGCGYTVSGTGKRSDHYPPTENAVYFFSLPDRSSITPCGDEEKQVSGGADLRSGKSSDRRDRQLEKTSH